MKKYIKQKGLLLFILLMTISLFSCGARKVDKTRTSELVSVESQDNSKTDIKTDLSLKTSSTIKVDDKNETITEESVFEPCDPMQPSSIIDENGKKTILNNVKKVVRKTTQKNNTKTDNSVVSNLEKSKNTSTKNNLHKKSIQDKGSESIKIDREAWSMWNFLWLLIPIVLILLIWKNKAKIIGWFSGV